MTTTIHFNPFGASIHRIETNVSSNNVIDPSTSFRDRLVSEISFPPQPPTPTPSYVTVVFRLHPKSNTSLITSYNISIVTVNTFTFNLNVVSGPFYAIPGSYTFSVIVYITTGLNYYAPSTYITYDRNFTRFTNAILAFSYGPDLNNLPEDVDVACYLKGTHILTPKGETLIENLSVGDEVLTYNNGSIGIDRIKWVGKLTPVALDKDSYPIKICKSAIRNNVPYRDLYLSPGHNVSIDNKLVLANNLVNNKSIYQDTSIDSVQYYHIELSNHSLVFAEGLLAETYVDCNNRHLFDDKYLSNVSKDKNTIIVSNNSCLKPILCNSFSQAIETSVI